MACDEHKLYLLVQLSLCVWAEVNEMVVSVEEKDNDHQWQMRWICPNECVFS